MPSAPAAFNCGMSTRTSASSTTVSTEYQPVEARPFTVGAWRAAWRDGEGVYSEGCLSIPELYVDILRPNRVLVRGLDIDGNEVEFEAEELMGRMFQHEIDHLNGVLMFDRMTPEQRKEALTEYRRLQETPAAPAQRRRLRLK